MASQEPKLTSRRLRPTSLAMAKGTVAAHAEARSGRGGTMDGVTVGRGVGELGEMRGGGSWGVEGGRRGAEGRRKS